MSRGYSAVGLFHPKFKVNVGTALRVCGNYQCAFLATEGQRFRGKSFHGDTMKQSRHLPFFQVDNLHAIIPHSCVPVAVEIQEGAQSLINYSHPERAFYIFGPEDGSLGKAVYSYCRDIIYVPTVECMNLAVTIAVVLYDRLLKGAKKCQ